ncbi:E3 SUMO-protein ligase ZBED1-like [Watersipora subatra]|uniref:E3 SUMO-protein ligase ZBED1-like n=1 Tax=Watersipora subatra TaxID=2589382 RepID=UPI00355C8857
MATAKKTKSPVTCDDCGLKIKRSDCNTTNLFAHLKNHHPLKYDQVKKRPPGKSTYVDKQAPQQTKLQEVWDKKRQYAPEDKAQARITNAITRCLAKDSMPLYTVEKQGFKDLIECLDPRFKMPSRKLFSDKLIPSLYSETKTGVCNQLANITHFSLTTDGWSSIGLTPYLSLTVHYVSPEWDLVTKNLNTVYLPESHTGQKIAETLEELLTQWNLDKSKLVSLTTDNASNMVVAAKILEKPRIGCIGHILDNAIKSATVPKEGKNAVVDPELHEINEAVKACRGLVAVFSSSFQKKRELSEAQKELGVPVKSLITDCKTRWGSKLKMVNRVLENERPIRRVLGASRQHVQKLPDADQFSVLESFASALEPFETLTDALSGDQDVTVSAVIPLVEHLIAIAKPVEALTPLATTIRKNVKEYVITKFGYEDDEQDPTMEVMQLLGKATILDPRYKDGHLLDGLKVAISEQLCAEAAASVNSSVDSGEEMVVQDRADDQAEHQQTEPPAKKSLHGLLMGSQSRRLPHEERGKEDVSVECACELARYLAKEYPVCSAEMNPLHWWRTHNPSLPHLSTLAKKYLSMCATSCSSERLFSCSGNIVNKRRSCLKPQKVDQLVFLACNL